MRPNDKYLIIQTSFIGDAILATAILEKIRSQYPKAQIDLLVRKGNESLFDHHPYISNLYVWNKKEAKYLKLWQILKQIRRQKYNYVINLQRFASTGLLTILSGAKQTLGFDKNPFSMFFSKRFSHQIGDGTHEVARNQNLIAHLTDTQHALPRLYPSDPDFDNIKPYQSREYICIAPTSVWFTKQFPAKNWVKFLDQTSFEGQIFLLGAASDTQHCNTIINNCKNKNVVNLAGKLTMLQSCALMKGAVISFVNDSAPLHLASAMDAPVCVIFCSTIPAFGFGPLSTQAFVLKHFETLPCRPCGLHGHKACPQQHFRCSEIPINNLEKVLRNVHSGSK